MLGSCTFGFLPPSIALGTTRAEISNGLYDAVVVLHESWDSVHAGRVLVDYLNAPSMVFTPTPGFPRSKERLPSIVRALVLCSLDPGDYGLGAWVA